MLGIAAIHRLASSGREGLLLARVLENGRPLCLAARLRLESAESLAPAARGLALVRLCELTHRPAPDAVDLALSLPPMQDDLGKIGGWAGHCCALAGLLALLEQDEQRPGAVSLADRATLEAAVEAAVHALACSWEANGLTGKLGQDAIDTAIALWVLHDRPGARRRLPLQAIERWLGCPDARQVPETAALAPLGRAEGRGDVAGAPIWPRAA